MPSKQFELVETRRISGRGLFKVTPQNRDRHFRLWVDLIRPPRIDFSNSKYNPDRSEYAKITWLKGGYVVKENAVNYERQVFDWYVDSAGFLAPALACIYRSIIDYLDYLAPFIPAPPLVTDPTDPIYIEPLRIDFDEIRIVCRADAALSCALYRLEYDWQCPEGEPTPKLPPPPPPPEQDPPGTPLDDISPPYDRATNDNGNTIPDPSDEFPPDPPDFWAVRIIGQWYGGGCTITPPGSVYADLGLVSTSNLELQHTGTGGACGGFTFVVRNLDDNSIIFTSTSEGFSLDLEITPVEE